MNAQDLNQGPKFTSPLPLTPSTNSLALAKIVQRHMEDLHAAPVVTTDSSVVDAVYIELTPTHNQQKHTEGKDSEETVSSDGRERKESADEFSKGISSELPNVSLNSEHHLARIFEYYRINNPELYAAIKMVIEFDQTLKCYKVTPDSLLNLMVFMIVLLPMAFEYFFPAQAAISGYGALPFSIDSVILNTALTALLIGSHIKSLILNLITLVNNAREAETFMERLKTITDAADRNFLPLSWSRQGRAVLGHIYRDDSARYSWEMIKPIPSLMIKILGFVAVLCFSAILYQNSENSYFTALDKQEWLSKFFNSKDYKNGLIALNVATIILNTPLYSQDYIESIVSVIDTDVVSLADSNKKIPGVIESIKDYLESFVRSGAETPGLTKKLQYIINSMGAQQMKELKNAVALAITEMASVIPEGASELDFALIEPAKVKLEKKAAALIRPIDGQVWFKAIGLACLLMSLVTSYYYCMGSKELFGAAANNPNLSPMIRGILKAFQADTTAGQIALSFLSSGIFGVVHSTDGFRIACRDIGVQIYEAEGCSAKSKAAIAGLGTIALAAGSSLTGAVEAGGSGDMVSLICGGLKGASVNLKGARLAAEKVTEMISMAISTGASCVSSSASALTATFLGNAITPSAAKASSGELTTPLME